MNNLPSYLFEDLVIENNMLVVCVEHNKFIPCRACLRDGTNFSSSDPEDIKRVSDYQRGKSSE